jgi:drug/metabolite transporter (DMT)-like permease
VLAVLGGLGAALCWASATITATRASRLAGSQRVVGWVMIIGFAVALPLVVVSGVPAGLDWRQIGWLAVSGVGNVAGLLCAYAALKIGKISIVTPITSTEGAIAAVFAVLEGERLGGATAILLVLIALGVLIASSGETAGAPGAHPVRATGLAIFAAFMFGASLFATGRVSQALPISWALLPPRLVGIVAVSIPLLARRQLRIQRPAVPFVVVAGLSEIAGSTAFAFSARHGIAIAAVLGSQFATLAIVASYFLFHERLRRLQVAGVVAVLVCVAVLTAVRA